LRISPLHLAPSASQPAGEARPRSRWALMAAAALFVSACSGGSNEIAEPRPSTNSGPTTEATTTSTSSSTSTSPTSDTDDAPAEDQEVIDRYLGFWDARFGANEEPPDPEDPALADFATGRQLENVIDETRRRLEDGLALRAAEPSRTSHDVAVITKNADRVELQDCFVNDGIVYRPATGEVVDDSVVTRSVSADMVLVDGVWKLERATVVQQWEGIAGCALAD
jgi:hypothetical protein